MPAGTAIDGAPVASSSSDVQVTSGSANEWSPKARWAENMAWDESVSAFPNITRRRSGVIRSMRRARKPQALAHARSKPLQDTSPISHAGRPKASCKARYASGCGLKTRAASVLTTRSNRRSHPGVGEQGREHGRGAVGEDAEPVVLQAGQRLFSVGIERQAALAEVRRRRLVRPGHDGVESGAEGVARDCCEVGVAPHDGPQPAVFELLESPKVGDELAAERQRLRDRHARDPP